MSQAAVNQIIERAVADEAYFEQLRTEPEKATAGYELDVSELSAFRVGAYNVVVRGNRKDLADRAAIDAARSAPPAAAAATASQPSRPRMPIGGLIGFFGAVLIIGGGIGGFRYTQNQWPWQALGLAPEAATAPIPKPTLGARPKPNTAASPEAPAAVAPASAAPASPAAASPSAAANASAQAQLRPAATPSPVPVSSTAAAAAAVEVQRAYYQNVAIRLNTVVQSYGGMLQAIRGNTDPTKDLLAFSAALADLKAHAADAPPPDQLRQQHQTLVQAIPVLQADVDQMKTSLASSNQTQSILVAVEIQAVLTQMSDLVNYATAAHPELYQAIDSQQQLSNALQFDVVNQTLNGVNNAPPAVQVRIALPGQSPTNEQVSETLRRSIVAVRQSYPQAGQVHVTGFKVANGQLGAQVGVADWYCSPAAKPPDAPNSANWQDSCGKVYVTLQGAGPASFPY